MAVRSKRILGPTQLSTSLTTVYTVPSGRTAIVRTAYIYNQHSTDVSVLLTINGTGVADRLGNFLVPAARQIVLPAELVLNPGDVLRASASVSSVAELTLFGSLLLGEPT